ncbi:GNAT family N-acetyltransferase [Streptomyces albipurpureus]|uniref:GNAT family N-acetyltransferase n=1 Tax=Streptomyces albipurpureus TaxID=2897419 RepID=A0ABT0URS9_9ACTN|nr:GNAT family N-acetyltransferase [Streptomyces sp. CWNU-1]MCM2390699.1 GNAT family N-acetyltransferase [Streptomyces sp. CWNU-1]
MTNPLGETVQTSDTTGAARFSVSSATREEWRLVAEWCAAEGWNPGDGDAECFHPTDPAGFFIGRLDGEPVSSISVVNYSDEYAFLGYYVVRPDLRGQGWGLATWRAAFPHAGNRLVGLDAVPAQQDNYQRSGFSPAYGTVRYGGVPQRVDVVDEGVTPITAQDLEAIAEYDRDCFPADRRAFLSRWLTAPGHIAHARWRDGRVTGYGVIRPGRDSHRIGPLFADTAPDAAAVLDGLTAHLGPTDEVAVDMPQTQEAAAALATDRGLTAQFPTVRMYTGPAPQIRADRVFGVTTLELG